MENQTILDMNTVANRIDRHFQNQATGLIPGQKIENLPLEISEEDAQKNLIQRTAQLKLKDELDRMKALEDEDKIREFVIKNEFWNQCNRFFNEKGYEMSGQEKRVLKKKIEKMYDKGKFKLTAEQKQDILYELNKYSASAKENNRLQ